MLLLLLSSKSKGLAGRFEFEERVQREFDQNFENGRIRTETVVAKSKMREERKGRIRERCHFEKFELPREALPDVEKPFRTVLLRSQLRKTEGNSKSKQREGCKG